MGWNASKRKIAKEKAQEMHTDEEKLVYTHRNPLKHKSRNHNMYTEGLQGFKKQQQHPALILSFWDNETPKDAIELISHWPFC